MGTGSKQRKVYGPRGRGSIVTLPVEAVTPEDWKEIKVTIFDAEGHKEVFRLDPADVTREFGSWALKPINDVFVELTAEEDNIKSIRPLEGTFLLRFSRFAARVNAETGEALAPTIKNKDAERVTIPATGASWVNPPHSEFYAILKVVATEIGKETELAGLEAVRPLVYMFERNPQTGLVDIIWDRKFWYDQLINFLTVTGYDFDADSLMPSENVLGELQNILQGRNRAFRGDFQNGWLQRDLTDAPIGVEI